MDQENIYIIDTETTGADYFNSDVLWISIEPLQSKQGLDIFVRYPDADITWSSVAKRYFNSYKSEWESKAVEASAAMNTLNQYLEESKKSCITLAGHNVFFDYYFLSKLANKTNINLSKKVSHRLLDTHTILAYQNIRGKLPDYALKSNGAADYFKLDRSNKHFAREDVKMTKETLKQLIRI